MASLTSLLQENRFQPQDVPAFENKLFFEGQRRRPYLERFGVLLFLATMIATVGIISDSTATVIGAMIIAPLMLPIMATTAALVMGKMERAVQSILLVIAGIAGVILLSWFLGVLYPDVISFSSNSQILARTSPRFVDLVAALASGAAGAFCMSRDDIADSLPGVAIAISLVPPLCVVGISLAYGEWIAASGAMLLFLTNMLAILLAGGSVLVLLGLTHAATVQLRGTARRYAFRLIGFAVVLISVPLWSTGMRINADIRTQVIIRQEMEQWLAGSEYKLVQAQGNGNQANLIILGTGEVPPFDQLTSALQTKVGPQLSVELEILPAQKLIKTSVAPLVR